MINTIYILKNKINDKIYIGHTRNKGKPHTSEHNAKISKSLLGNTRAKGKTWKLVDGKRVWNDK